MTKGVARAAVAPTALAMVEEEAGSEGVEKVERAEGLAKEVSTAARVVGRSTSQLRQ